LRHGNFAALGRELCREPLYNGVKTGSPDMGYVGGVDRGIRARHMKLIVKLLFVVAVLGLAGLTGFAYLTDLAPEQQTVTQPVILDAR